MSTEWQNVSDPEALFCLHREGWEIEVKFSFENTWSPWDGKGWTIHWQFRARPRQPKPEKVKYECFDTGGRLEWLAPNVSVLSDWGRVPSEDKEVEVIK